MAFLGEDPNVQYTAPIGPLPETGDPMSSSLVVPAVVGVATAVIAGPLVGLAVFGGSWFMSKKKREIAGGH
jgi:hypothetical protein